jgi:hypothetical protein
MTIDVAQRERWLREYANELFEHPPISSLKKTSGLDDHQRRNIATNYAGKDIVRAIKALERAGLRVVEGAPVAPTSSLFEEAL